MVGGNGLLGWRQGMGVWREGCYVVREENCGDLEEWGEGGG